MSNNIQIFNNEEFGEVRITIIDRKEYFVAKDIALALGYTNPQKAIRDHCKGVNETGIPTNGGIQTIKVIPESDIYRLIIRSKLPSAQKFEEWVFEEVLPTIRKTGGYVADSNKFVEKYFGDLDPDIKFIIQSSLDRIDAQKRIIKEQEDLIDKQQPKVEFANAISGADTNITIGEMAKILKQNGYNTGQNRLYKELRSKGYIMNTDSITNRTPTQLAIDLGILVIKESSVEICKDNEYRTIIDRSTRVTPKGQQYFIKKLCQTK